MSISLEDVSKSSTDRDSYQSYSSDPSLEAKTDDTLLQNLPVAVLEEVLSYLSYEFCLSLRTLSSSFHEAVSRKFRVGYKSLFTRIRKKMQNVEIRIKPMTTHLRRFSDGEVVMRLMMRYSIMRILDAEATMLKAICHRYIDNGQWNFFSYSGAVLLEHFHNIISLLEADQTDATDTDPNITSELLFLSGQFIYHFTSIVEPSLDFTVPFEVKLADILDSIKDSTVSYRIIDWDSGYRLSTRYYLKNLASLEFPWNVFEPVPTEEKLKSILMTMKNNVRYSNYCYPLREVWLMEDILDVSGVQGLGEYLSGPKHYHERDGEEVPCYRTHHEVEWTVGDGGWTRMNDEIHRQNPYFVDVHIVEAEFQIEGGPKPLKLVSSGEEDENNTQQLTGICDILLNIQHPSKWDLRTQKSCIKIEGKNGTYSIKAHYHNHH